MEHAAPAETPTPTPAPRIAEKLALTAKGRKLAKGEKASPSPTAIANKPAIATQPQSRRHTDRRAPALPVAPIIVACSSRRRHADRAVNQSVNPDTGIGVTAGGGSWKTYPAGKMPVGRLINTTDLAGIADLRSCRRERVYLRGQFVVNFAESESRRYFARKIN